MWCPICGVDNAEQARFCAKCGAPMEGAAGEEPAPAPEAAQEAPVPPEPFAEVAQPPQPEPAIPEQPAPPQPAGPPPQPPRKGRAGLVIAIIVVLFVLLGACAGVALAVTGSNKARAEAEAAVAAAETLVADAELCAEEGTDAAGEVDAAKSLLSDAKAQLGVGSPFSSGPYKKATSLAEEASSKADGVLVVLQERLDRAESLRDEGDYQGAIGEWAGLVKEYPRSRFATDARQAAVGMIAHEVADADLAWDEELRLCADVAKMHGSALPDDLKSHACDILLELARSELDTLQDLTWANANWATDIDRKASISGEIVWEFQTQSYDDGSVKWITGIQGVVPKLGQPKEMTRLFTLLVDTTKLASACKYVADHPTKETANSETFSSSQIKKVKSNAATMQRNVDEAKKLVAAIENAR